MLLKFLKRILNKISRAFPIFKLLKHELHEAGRMLLPIFGGLLLFAAVTRGIIWIMEQSDNDLLRIMGIMFVALFFIACIASVVVAAVLMIIRFGKTVHGDEGYLTHTLPVGVHSILLSRILVTFLALLVSICVAYLGIRISLWKVQAASDFAKELSFVFEAMGLDSSTLWMAIAYYGTNLLTTILLIFAAISIGHSFNRGKVGFSILFYFAIESGFSILSAVISLVMMPNLLDESADLGAVMGSFGLIAVGLNLLCCVVCYFLAWIMTKKRLNLA